MNSKVRGVLAVIAGIVLAMLMVAVIESIGHAVYPPPESLDFTKPDQVREYIEKLPLGAFLFVLTGWIGGTFCGGLVAAWIGRTKPMVFSMIVGAFVLAATIANLTMIPHPAWMAIIGILGIVVAAVLAGTLLRPRADDESLP